MPRRRRPASAIDTESERGLLMRVLLYSPKDMIAGAVAFAAVSAIVANALFLQRGRIRRRCSARPSRCRRVRCRGPVHCRVRRTG